MPVILRVPSRSIIRIWILKFSLNKLREPKEKRNDWALILDHTIQMGKVKILIVLGIALSHLPFNRGLTLADMHIMNILPMESSTGPKIHEILINLKNELGTIKEIVSDEGSDVKSDVNLYRVNNQDCIYINDIVHKLAHLLQAELKDNVAWEELLKRSSELRTKLLQTSSAHFVPPKRRDKARYLNLEKFIKWGFRLFKAWENPEFSVKDREIIFKEFAWAFRLEEEVRHFHHLWQVTSITRDLIRNYGIQIDTGKILSKMLQNLDLNCAAQLFADKIVRFVSEQSEKVQLNERLLGSSEIIESLIGSMKHHFNTQNRSGFTSFTLIASALTGEINKEAVLDSMKKIKMKDLKEWEKNNFNSTIQKKRAKFYQQAPLYDYESRKSNGTENGTFFTADLDPEIV